MAKEVIKVKNLSKAYQTGEVVTKALDNLNFSISEGEFVAIMGPSGSGKSTLMHILGALDLPSNGEYLLDGQNIEKLDEDELSEIRNKKIGFVFQAFNLLPRTTTLKNVALPMMYAGYKKEDAEKRAKELLELVGLGNRLAHTSNQISGGQQQRVAIARALSMSPSLLLADEPTGNIASAQAEEIMAIFKSLNQKGHTIVMITHEQDIADNAKRIITIKDGRLLSDMKRN